MDTKLWAKPIRPGEGAEAEEHFADKVNPPIGNADRSADPGTGIGLNGRNGIDCQGDR